jgi:hypothetical protein
MLTTISSSQTNNNNTNNTDNTSSSPQTEPILTLPSNKPINRTPGNYEDIYSKYKIKHNLYILHACKLLSTYHESTPSITALVLDGKQHRSTRALLTIKEKISKIYIVEINTKTFETIQHSLKDYTNITVLNQHIGDFIKNNNNPYVNVVYFDVMCSFFSSDLTEGSDAIIELFLQQSKVNEMIFASTFCLRSAFPIVYHKQKKKIISKLKLMFLLNGFNAKMLINDKEVIYKGQRAHNQGMMFVIFYLYRN